MAKRDKLIIRLLSMPRDFSWEELTKLLNGFGYIWVAGGKTGGSRVRFVYPGRVPITLHRPHPKPILKRYQLSQVINMLRQEGLL